jgi:hypothetical protein
MCGTMGVYDDVVAMPLGGKVRTIDRCISHVVAALNAGGVETVACCCGHGKLPGRIDLSDGRVLVVMTPAGAAALQGASALVTRLEAEISYLRESYGEPFALAEIAGDIRALCVSAQPATASTDSQET